MSTQRNVTYGLGGFDPNLPDGNIVAEEWVEVPDPPVDPLTNLTPEQLTAIYAALGM